jgi:hypothetical protein
MEESETQQYYVSMFQFGESDQTRWQVFESDTRRNKRISKISLMFQSDMAALDSFTI